jgi:hypothetical protein
VRLKGVKSPRVGVLIANYGHVWNLENGRSGIDAQISRGWVPQKSPSVMVSFLGDGIKDAQWLKYLIANKPQPRALDLQPLTRNP